MNQIVQEPDCSQSDNSNSKSSSQVRSRMAINNQDLDDSIDDADEGYDVDKDDEKDCDKDDEKNCEKEGEKEKEKTMKKKGRGLAKNYALVSTLPDYPSALKFRRPHPRKASLKNPR